MKEMALQALSLIVGGLEEETMGGRSERVHEARSSITGRPKQNQKFTPIVRNSGVTLRKNSDKVLVRRTCLFGVPPSSYETAVKPYKLI